MIGSTLSHFRITAKLGEGGMGEVYRAEDSRLGREVAIKVLPEAVAKDPERLARFEREARVLAALDHPNIAAIHGLEEADGRKLLVMQLAEGETLEERLSRGPIPIDEALSIALQIAEALEAAHERGIVHRDLKPANVKVTPAGQVRVLDFGLAKALEPGADSDSEPVLTKSPTLTARMTAAGVLLGTAAYMSPEQARGQSVDRRADIWAFGCVLFEMLTGQRLFAGETVSDTLAAILRETPAWKELPKDTPGAIRQLLRRCLDRDSRRRLRDIGEARILLEDPTAAGLTGEGPTATAAWRSLRARMIVAVGLALVLGATAAWLAVRQQAPPLSTATLALEVAVPEGLVPGSMALSPDGTHLAFVVRDEAGKQRLWVRPLDSYAARSLPGTEEARDPFWSPDSREIGFFAGEQVKSITLDGTAARTVNRAPLAVGGVWGEDGTLYFGSRRGPIYATSAAGSSPPVPVFNRSPEEADLTYAWPVLLADQRHLVALRDGAAPGRPGTHAFEIVSIDGGTPQTLLVGIQSSPVVDPRGYLLYSKDNQLLAHRFDPDRLELVGTPSLVADRVLPGGLFHDIGATASGHGLVAYQTGTTSSELVWQDDSGQVLDEVLSGEAFSNPRLSPDGKYLAIEIQHSSQDRAIWVYDLERGARTLLSERGRLSDSVAWSPDSRWVYFDAFDSEAWRAYRQPREGSARPEVVLDRGFSDLIVYEVSPDGRWLLFGAPAKGREWNLFLLALDDPDAEPVAWIDSPFEELSARFSPDARWIAYVIHESGRQEVYVRAVERRAARRWQISSGGGTDPSWSPDGRRLYYRSGAGKLMAVEIEIQQDELRAASPETLFDLAELPGIFVRNGYDIGPDGERFLVLRSAGAAATSIHVLSGWNPDKSP